MVGVYVLNFMVSVMIAAFDDLGVLVFIVGQIFTYIFLYFCGICFSL